MINESEYAQVVTQLRIRLDAAAATGPPAAIPFNKTDVNMLQTEICAQEATTGYEEPVRESLSPSPPSPPGPPAPSPVPPPNKAQCGKALAKHCPLDQFKHYTNCLACSRAHANSPVCKPAERQRYCHAIPPEESAGALAPGSWVFNVSFPSAWTGLVVGFLDPRSGNGEAPESFYAVPETAAGISLLNSSSKSQTGDTAKTLAHFSGGRLDLYISHGQTLWPCSTIDGSMQPPQWYLRNVSYAINATFIGTWPGGSNQYFQCGLLNVPPHMIQ